MAVGGVPRTGPGCEPTAEAPRICLLGGALSTGNLGVSALSVASIKNILNTLPGARILLQNWGECARVRVCIGGRDEWVETTRVHSSTSLRMTAGTRHLGLLAAIHRSVPGFLGRGVRGINRHFAELADVDSALALCGGDSFSDLYGEQVLEVLSSVMLLMANMGKQLILMPQTIGPFGSSRSRDLACRVMSACDLVAIRDLGGAAGLGNTLGGWLPRRVVECPDVAFTLDPVPVSPDREPFALDGADGRPLIGLNVSGMLYLSRRDFGLKESYSRLIDEIAGWVLSRGDRRLLLVPHVISRTPPDEESGALDLSRDVSDTVACRLVQAALAPRYGDRVGCVGWPRTESETKYLIGRCEFMIGARMHSCIAGVSQGIPTVTLAYSDKARGVMGHLGEWAPVIDLRSCTVAECVQDIDRWYGRRAETRGRLLQAMTAIRSQVEHFFSHVLRPTVLGPGLPGRAGGS